MTHRAAFSPGRYLVDAPYEDVLLPGPAGSPVGRWHYHVSVAPDGSGVWTNLDGVVVYRMPDPGEAEEFLQTCLLAGHSVSPSA